MEKQQKTDKNMKISKLASECGTLVFLAMLFIIFSILRPKTFLSMGNMLTILRQIVILSILGAGLTVVMITNRIDLTIGYTTSFLGVVAGALMVHFGLPVWLSAIITILEGAFLGSLSGISVAILGIPDFIATLSLGFLISGFNQSYTKGHPISGLPEGFKIFGAKFIGRIPTSLFFMVAFVAIIYILLNYTRFGRYIYAIGGNEEAAIMSGVDVNKNIIKAYIISGIGAGLASLILASKLGTAHPTAGDSYLMEALATVYVGGTVFKSGEPNIAGTFVGALIIGILSNGLTLCNVQYYNQNIAKGLVIFLAVTITSIQKKRKK
mgnify:FL=1